MKTYPQLGSALPVVPRRVLAGLACQAVGALASAVPLAVVAELGVRVTEAGLAGGWPTADRVWPLVTLAAAALVVRVAAGVAAATLTHLGDADLQLRLRRQIAAHLARLPLGWFGTHNSATVKRAAADDVGALHHVVAHAWPARISAVVVPVALAGYLVLVDWRLTLVVLALLGLGWSVNRWGLRDVTDRMAEYHAATGRLDAAAVELVRGIPVVKVFTDSRDGGRVHSRFQKAAAAYADFLAGWARRVAPWSLLSQLLYSPVLVLWVVLLAGAGMYAAGWLALPHLVPFLVVAPALSAPALSLGYSSQEVAAGQAAADRIGALLATRPLPEPAPEAKAVPVHPATSPAPGPPRGLEVRIESVSFSYDGQREVLREVSVRLPAGTVTALVGPSGAGKSTLATLVARFADVSAGAVRIGGVDVRDLPAAQLHRLVGFVFQDTPALRLPVIDNIRLGDPEADLDRVCAAATAAQLQQRIATLPRGYDTVLGEQATLSAGEAQRLAIARALLADPPVLVLDEATAYTDPECEAQVQEAIAALAAGRTVLVVAHRLDSIVDADQIVVLEDGEVVQVGRHAELLSEPDGRYARLWRAQHPQPQAVGAGLGQQPS